MAITRTGSAKAATSNGLTFTTPTFDVPSGTTLIHGYLADFSGVAVGVLTNNHGDTVVMGTAQSNGNVRVRAFWIINPTADSVYSLTATHASNFYPGLAWGWYAGTHATPFVAQSGAPSDGATGNLVPTEDGCLLTCGSGHESASTATTLLTERQDQAYVGGTSFGTSFADEIQTTATTRNPSITSVYAVAGVVFKAAAAAGGGVVGKARQQNQAVKRASYW